MRPLSSPFIFKISITVLVLEMRQLKPRQVNNLPIASQQS